MVTPIFDLHEDVATYFLLHGEGMPLGDFNTDLPGRDADIPKYLRGGVKLVITTVGAPIIETYDPENSRRLQGLYGTWHPGIRIRASLLPMVLESFEIYYRLAEYNPQIRIVEGQGDLDQVMGSDKVGFLLHMEGADAIEDPYDLVALKKLGLRSLGLTWNYNNKYASGCMSRKDYGLTPEGEELVRMAERLGIMIDLAHTSKRTALDVLAIAKKPVYISHANIRRLMDTPRNVDDEVLEALRKNGGVIGISAIPSIITRKKPPTIDDLAQHFLYVYETYGPDILAIGTDFMGLLGTERVVGFEAIDKVQELLSRLAEKGVGDNDIEKIAHKNAERVIRANLQ
ncbi:dipeptidase [Vulcanisaeta thermophila]|uniref:dipeptidase n=1 Tax=Vulcanisaeta thermophila TaxID=867917 RepID=UPI0009FC47D8|nr:dipeptidase [Vulcanisaeta thermophila]